MAGKKGFAAMSREKQREIAQLGGKAAWAKGKAHRWSREAAGLAGKIGGRVSKKK